MDEDLEEALAGLIGLGLGAGLVFAVSNLMISSAESWSNLSQAAVRQNNNTAVLELATCARCVNQILRPINGRVGKRPPQSEEALSTAEQYERLSAGAPVVT